MKCVICGKFSTEKLKLLSVMNMELCWEHDLAFQMEPKARDFCNMLLTIDAEMMLIHSALSGTSDLVAAREQAIRLSTARIEVLNNADDFVKDWLKRMLEEESAKRTIAEAVKIKLAAESASVKPVEGKA